MPAKNPLFKILLAFSAVCAFTAQPAARELHSNYKHPYLAYPYDPRGELVLARYRGGEVTDLDLYLYQLMMDYGKPEVFDLYYRSRRASAREKLAPVLEERIRNYIFSLEMGRAGRLAERTPGASQLLLRYYELPVAAWVWMTEALQPLIVIEQPDRVYYYNQHRDQFIRNEQAVVRVIFLELDEQATLETENETRRILDLLRVSLLEGADFAQLAHEYSEAPSAPDGGLLPPLEKGRFDFTIEEQVFALQPGELTPVFRGPGGYYLIKVEERRPYKELSLREAQLEIDEALNKHILQELFSLRFSQITRRLATLQDTQQLFARPPEQVIVQVGRRQIRVEQVLELFPEIYSSPVALNRRELGAGITRAHDGEVIAQHVESLGLQDDRRLRRARELAVLLAKSRMSYFELREGVNPAITAAEFETFYRDNLSSFTFNRQYRVFKISATPANLGRLPPQELVRRREKFNAALTQLVAELQPVAREYVARRAAADEQRAVEARPDREIAPDGADKSEDAVVTELENQRRLMHVPVIIRDLPQHSTGDVTYRAQDLGFITKSSNKTVYARLDENLREGDFTATYREGASYVVYYIDRLIPGEVADSDEYRWEIREALLTARVRQALDERFDAIITAAEVEFLFPQLQSAPEYSADSRINLRDFK